MESNLLKSILGLSGFDPGYLVIAVAVLLVLVIVLLIVSIAGASKNKKLSRRIDALCAGKNAESLELEINKILEENKYLMSEVSEHKAYIKTIFKRLKMAYQKFALVKYDALDQMGGQLSFVLAFLDENNNGFLLNSVHSATMNYIYSKNVVEGEVEVELGAEEAEALEKAMSVKIPK
ncbi:MAG: DUF4446 family protein [Lachnospiraceae bacterium]|nr:DUF4446 family protein [Lachnospiraceae bacterium]